MFDANTLPRSNVANSMTSNMHITFLNQAKLPVSPKPATSKSQSDTLCYHKEINTCSIKYSCSVEEGFPWKLHQLLGGKTKY